MKDFIPAIDRYRIDATPEHFIYIENREQPDGQEKWAVMWLAYALNNQDEWEYEPMPSSRTDEYLARTRFSYGEALYRAQKAATKLFVNYEERRARLALNTN